jgi:uncharacterized protein (TIGR02271 family)
MRFATIAKCPDLAFPPGTFDVRGWDVRTARDEEKIGTVDDLIFEAARRRPRYLDVATGLLRRHVLLPLGRAFVDAARALVWIPEMTKDRMREMPDYAGDVATISDDYEERIRDSWSAGAADEEGLYDAARFYARRAAPPPGPAEARGEATGVVTRVEREDVVLPVTRRREEAEIERRPVAPGEAPPAAIAEGEIRVPITEEEIVIEKRPVVREEIIIRKRPVEETVEVHAELRRERVEIERSGGAAPPAPTP